MTSITEKFSIESIITACKSDLMFDPSVIYCQFTGAPIGSLHINEFQLILDQINPDSSLDELVDDLMVRTICAMRPSPAWNYIRRETYAQMSLLAPHRLVTMLLGRFYAPRDRTDSVLRRSMADRIRDGRDLIVLFDKLKDVDSASDEFQHFMESLLNFDYRFDLAQATFPKDFPASVTEFQPSAIGEYLKMIRAHAADLQKKKNTLERKAKLHDSWLAAGGRRIVGVAAVATWKRLKPLNESEVRKQQRDRTRADMRFLLMQIMDGDLNVEIPKPKPELIVKPTATVDSAPLPNGLLRLKINKGL